MIGTRPRAVALGLSAALALIGASVISAAQNQAPASLMKPGELEKLPAGAPDARVSYGSEPSQFAELRVPTGKGPHPVVVLVHGGCWRAEFATLRDLPALADALKRAGLASLNVEYRRLGETGGGWPGTYLDVGQAIDYVDTLAEKYRLDRTRVVVVGHSAGGHLAMWAATRHKTPRTSPLFVERPLRIRGVVNLAGTVDMTQNIEAMSKACAAPVVERMLGGTLEAMPGRYGEVSANHRVPLGIPQVLIWGEHEDFVPRTLAQAHVKAATAAGDDARLLVVPSAGHFELANPSSAAYRYVLDAITLMLK